MTTTPQDIQAALEPCLVCGHDKAFHFIEAYGPMNGLSYIKCQDCNWRTCYCDTKDVAINEWNTRVQSAAPAQDAGGLDIEALRQDVYAEVSRHCVGEISPTDAGYGAKIAFDHLAPRLARSEWMPIKTAPKDGTRILVVDEGVVSEAYFNDCGECFAANTCSTDWVDGQLYCPTLWQPLPVAPQQKKGE